MTHPAIHIQNLTKKYDLPDAPLVLKGITLDIPTGEIFSLLGPNGAGKSTLIAILSGLLPPTSGNAEIAGFDVQKDSLAVKRVIGVIPEEVALYPQLSGYRNLWYFGQLYGIKGRTLKNRIDEVFDLINLSHRAKDKVAQYSNGMKRRLNLGASLLHQPQVLFMDEPTLGLDPENRHQVLDLILRLKNERNTTILYTTHYMEEAHQLSDRVGIIHQGEIIAIGTPDELVRTLHAKDTLRMDLSALSSSQSKELEKDFQSMPDISAFQFSGLCITVTLQNTALVLPRILARIDQLGIPVISLTVQKPNLEAVFLHLTGQRLVDPA